MLLFGLRWFILNSNFVFQFFACVKSNSHALVTWRGKQISIHSVFILLDFGVNMRNVASPSVSAVRDSTDVHCDQNAATNCNNYWRCWGLGEPTFSRQCIWKGSLHIKIISVSEVNCNCTSLVSVGSFFCRFPLLN